MEKAVKQKGIMKEFCLQFKGGNILGSGSARSEQSAGFKGMVMTQAEAVVKINTIPGSERANTDSCWAHRTHTNREYYAVYGVCAFFLSFLSALEKQFSL